LRGTKRFEYRSRPTAIRGRVYIYASLKPGKAEEFNRMHVQPGDLPTGVLVGTVEITDCSGEPGDYKWHLARPQRLQRHLSAYEAPTASLVQSVLGSNSVEYVLSPLSRILVPHVLRSEELRPDKSCETFATLPRVTL
jgi:hypothetical protein